MDNLAGRPQKEATAACLAELQAAGINVIAVDPGHSEVQSAVGGQLAGWTFRRLWYYWAAKGPELDASMADEIWRTQGNVVRAGGDAGCRRPVSGGYPSADSYHIDTLDGLRVFAGLLQVWAA